MAMNWKTWILAPVVTTLGMTVLLSLVNFPDFFKKMTGGGQDALNQIMQRQREFGDVTNNRNANISRNIEIISRRISRMEGMYDVLSKQPSRLTGRSSGYTSVSPQPWGYRGTPSYYAAGYPTSYSGYPYAY